MIQERTVLEHTVARLNQLPLAGYVLAIGEQDNVAKMLAIFQSRTGKPISVWADAERVNSGAECTYDLSVSNLPI